MVTAIKKPQLHPLQRIWIPGLINIWSLGSPRALANWTFVACWNAGMPFLDKPWEIIGDTQPHPKWYFNMLFIIEIMMTEKTNEHPISGEIKPAFGQACFTSIRANHEPSWASSELNSSVTVAVATHICICSGNLEIWIWWVWGFGLRWGLGCWTVSRYSDLS